MFIQLSHGTKLKTNAMATTTSRNTAADSHDDGIGNGKCHHSSTKIIPLYTVQINLGNRTTYPKSQEVKELGASTSSSSSSSSSSIATTTCSSSSTYAANRHSQFHEATYCTWVPHSIRDHPIHDATVFKHQSSSITVAMVVATAMTIAKIILITVGIAQYIPMVIE